MFTVKFHITKICVKFLWKKNDNIEMMSNKVQGQTRIKQKYAQIFSLNPSARNDFCD